MRSYVEGKPKDWDTHLPFINMAMNATESRTTGFTPNMLMFGHEVFHPAELMFGMEPREAEGKEPAEWVKLIRERLAEAQNLARQILEQSQRQQKSTYDKQAHEVPLKVGDFVLKKEFSTKKGAKALVPVWIGPFLVIKARPPIFTIQGQKLRQALHHDHLKLCVDSEIPRWAHRKRQDLMDLDATLPYEMENGPPPPVIPQAPIVQPDKPLSPTTQGLPRKRTARSRDKGEITQVLEESPLDQLLGIAEQLAVPKKTSFGRVVRPPQIMDL